MTMNWDETLRIETEGMDERLADWHHFRYEPTPYEVLERLIDSGFICEHNHVLDVGCGKGRVSFFLAQTIGCRSTGIDFDPNMIEAAQKNKANFLKPEKVDFVCVKAEEARMTEMDCYYFFNPFSEKILRSVMGNIMKSYHEHPRKMQLFYYYPSRDVLAYLMSLNEWIFVDEIDCEDIYDEKDDRERIVIFETMNEEKPE